MTVFFTFMGLFLFSLAIQNSVNVDKIPLKRYNIEVAGKSTLIIGGKKIENRLR